MRALTLWQPMAWAIQQGHKPVENRSWPLPTNMIGQRFAVHAGKKYDPDWSDMIRGAFGLDVPVKSEIALGAVVAVATFRGCIDDVQLKTMSDRKLVELGMPEDSMDAIHDWYSGPHGFLISDVEPLRTPVPCRGFQGFWDLPEEIHAAVMAQLGNGAPVLVDDAPAVEPTPSKAPADEGLEVTRRPPRQMTLIDPIMLERERCIEIVRDAVSKWRPTNDVVADALETVATELE